jgi:hypothetical protein
MRNLITLAGLSAIVIGAAAPVSAAPTTLAIGTKVDMRLTAPLSSGTATVGQTFMAQAANNVTVGGATVVMKGAAGQGAVVAVNKAAGKSAGTITIDFKRVRAVDGSWVYLHDSKDTTMGNAEKGKASTATIASTIVLGPIGLFAHNMVKGKDITLDTSQHFPAWVKATTTVHVP